MVDTSQIFEDTQIQASDGEVKSIAYNVSRAIQLQEEIESLELTLKQREQELRTIVEIGLPMSMDAAGCARFDDKDTGVVVVIQDQINVSIPKGNEAKACTWLKARGHGDLIKHEIKATLSMGQDNMAPGIVQEIHDTYGIPVEDKVSVHHSTMAAFGRETYKAGQSLPEDVFSVYIGRKAKITSKKD